MRKIKIITGKKNVGKSTYMINKVKFHLNNSDKICGIITSKNNENGYDAIIIEDSKIIEVKDFITRKSYSDSIFKNFDFNNKIFNRVEKLINTYRYDIIVLDEIGKLEIFYKKGFYKIITKIIKDNIDFEILYLSIRDELLTEFVNNFNILKLFNNNEINELIIKRVINN